MTMTFFSFVKQHAFKHMNAGDMEKAAKKIREENENDLDVILKLQKLVVNDLKYINVPLKYTGFHCRTMDAVWESAYGTKLEKTILLTELLNFAGFRAYPVAVLPQKYYNRSIGNLLQFNDFMVQINPNSRDIIYLDATHIDKQNQIYNLEGKIVIQLDAAIESMRSFEEETASAELFLGGDIVLSDTNSITAELEQLATSWVNPYFEILQDSSKVKKMISGGLTSSDIKSFEINKLTEAETSADFILKMNKALKEKAGFYFFTLPYFKDGISNLLPSSISEDCDEPLDFHHLLSESYKFDISIPADMELLTQQLKFKARNDVGEVIINISSKEGNITVERSFELLKSEIEVADLTAFRELLSAWQNDQMKELVLRKK